MKTNEQEELMRRARIHVLTRDIESMSDSVENAPKLRELREELGLKLSACQGPFYVNSFTTEAFRRGSYEDRNLD